MTLTRAQLAVELRIVADEADAIPAGVAAVLDRLLAAASAAVTEYAPDAPEALQNEAVVRLAGRLFDVSGGQTRGGNPFVLSGAAHLLSRHRARSVTTPTVAEVSR